MGNNDASEGAVSSEDTKRLASTMQDRYSKVAGKGKSGADELGNLAMMSGEPMTMAAGATLKVVSSIADKRRKEREAAANAENSRRSKLMAALSSLGAGVGSTGMA